MRRKLINKGFSRGSLRFTTGKNSGRINKNDFAPQNGLRTRCLWALAETGFENSPILEGNKPVVISLTMEPFLTFENSPILTAGTDR